MYQANPPNLRHGERPWKLFDHSSRNFNRSSQSYERRSWGRMHEAGVIIYAVTEFIFQCATNREAKTKAELACLLKQICLERQEHFSYVVRCPVNLCDIVHHVRTKKETVEQYKQRISCRLAEAAEATKLAITCSSTAFKSALIPFGCAYAVKRGATGLNVALCKLKTIPDNMLHLLWQNMNAMLKETLTSRQQKGEFKFNATDYVLGYEVESQLIRLFRIMNTIFVKSSVTSLKGAFYESQGELRVSVSMFLSEGGANRRKMQKLNSIPSETLWNFVESRYSSGYLTSAIASTYIGGTEIGRVNHPSRNLVLAPKDHEIPALHVLSAQGISSQSNPNVALDASSVAPLFDIKLALRTEPILCINPKKTKFAWSTAAALGTILREVPGHHWKFILS